MKSLYKYNNKLSILSSRKQYTKYFCYKPCLYFVLIFFIFLLVSSLSWVFANENIIRYGVSSSGRKASIALVSQGHDIITDKVLLSMVTSVNSNSIGSLSVFSGFSYGESKYKTDSRINVNATSSLIGLAKGINFKFGRLTTGALFEYGDSNYDTFNSFDGFASVEGKGSAKYAGGGLLGYFDFKNNFYSEFSGRCGSTRTDLMHSSAKYDYSALYFGVHLGCGYTYKIDDGLGLNVYGKYIFAHLNGREVDLSEKDLIKFTDTDSQRIQIGTRLSYNVYELFNFYGGGAYEYEFNGAVGITDVNINATSLKGNSGIGELGVTGNLDKFFIDLGLQRYTGSREGFVGMLKISFAFLNCLEQFIGFSIEKFENEKIGRFNEVFAMSKKDCFNKSLNIIKNLKARVVHKSFKRGCIVAFDFAKSFDYCLDSTEAAVFITEMGINDIKVEIISNNSLLAKMLSVKFFEMLKS
ncbi:MAG: autotransporter outer membrane beta-barrel domain-containing protein [Endomicrobium sp.]|nr:autotransporter outer membrane beta-barrel domain-containing protein [Endomicrobium sp.]